MSDTKKIHLKISESMFEKAEEIAAKLYTTRSNVFRLTFYFNIKENINVDYLLVHEKRSDLVKTQVTIKESALNIFGKFDAYYFKHFDKNMYISAFVEKALEGITLRPKTATTTKRNTSVTVNNSLIKKIKSLHEKTGITKTCFINLAILLPIPNMDNKKKINGNEDEKSVLGIQLSQEFRNQLKFESEKFDLGLGEVLEIRLDEVINRLNIDP